ncbi:MAG: serine hydrolase [Candidatus Aminicenantales bacterium]
MSRRTIRTRLGFYGLIVVPFLLSACGSQPSLSDRITAHVTPFVKAGYFSGTLLIARANEVLYERSFGLANEEHAVPFTPETPSGIASITKPMTVVITARLIEEGKLSLDDKLSSWIPDFPEGDTITIDHLLNHRAGIPHRVTTPEQETVPRTAADMVELAKQKGLSFPRGARSVYSSAGYSVLARVLELAGGKPYEDLLNVYLFEPLGMAHSAPADAQALLRGRAQPYMSRGKGKINGPLQDLSFLVGAGSVYSTARDLFLMARAVVAGRLGEKVRQELIGEKGIVWNGSTNGYRAWVDWSKETDETYVLIANVQSGANDYFRQDLPRIVKGEDEAVRQVPEVKWVDVPREKLEVYNGEYELRPGSVMTVRAAEGGLYVNQWFLVPTSADTFFSPQDFGRVSAVYDEAGHFSHFLWEFAGGTLDMKPVK